MSTAEIGFWSAFAFTLYTYAGYPALIHLLSRLRSSESVVPAAPEFWPAVTCVVAVHNEEAQVARKIRNLQALDYPGDKVSIVFVSDGSTDRTNHVISLAPGVRLLSYANRQGKAYALNMAMSHVHTPIVVFTDVRQDLSSDAVRHLVDRLRDPEIGAVSGELTHRDSTSPDAGHVGLYWRYERWIRHAESRFFSTIGVTGALYAIRREDYSPIPVDTLLDDFEVPTRILRRGKRAVLEGRARIYDDLQRDASGERKRKVRTLTGNFQAFSRNGWLFVPWSNPVFVQFISHKVFRLLVPYSLALMLLTSLLASGAFYRAVAALQIGIYAAPLLGTAIPELRRTRLISFIAVFMELNWAAVLAMRNFVVGRLDVRWEKT